MSFDSAILPGNTINLMFCIHIIATVIYLPIFISDQFINLRIIDRINHAMIAISRLGHKNGIEYLDIWITGWCM